MNNNAASNEVQSIVRQISEHPIWQARKGHGSFVTLEMGKKLSRKRRDGTEILSGEFHLWIYMCRWDLSHNGLSLLTSEDIDLKNLGLLAKLEGEFLQAIEVKDPHTVLLTLSNGFTFELTSMSEEISDHDYFILYAHDSCVAFNKQRGLYLEI